MLVRVAKWNMLAKHADIIVGSIAKGHPQVPHQRYDRRRYSEGILWHHAFLWGYAQDGSRTPSFVMVPVSDNDVVLLRLMDGKEYPVGTTADSPLRTLPGMHFFDAWRLAPSQAQRIVASNNRSGKRPLLRMSSKRMRSQLGQPLLLQEGRRTYHQIRRCMS